MSGSHYAPEPDREWVTPAGATVRETPTGYVVTPSAPSGVRGGESAQYDVPAPDALHPLSDIAALRAEVAALRAEVGNHRKHYNGAVNILGAQLAHTDHAYVRLLETERADTARLDRRIDELNAAHARLVDVVQVLRLAAEGGK